MFRTLNKSGDGSAEPQHCLRRRNIYVPKGVHRPRKVQKNNKKRGTLLKEFLFIKVAMTYSPTKLVQTSAEGKFICIMPSAAEVRIYTKTKRLQINI